MDIERFNSACDFVTGSSLPQKGIGTLSEKTLHAILKRYFEPDSESHEIKIGRYVADIVGENGIIEIQTTGLDKLRKKLEVFLSVTQVTVVHPVARTRWLSWVDPETGEMLPKRKSPRKGSAFDAFYELYKIKMLLNNPNLNLCIVVLDMEEYRFLTKKGERKRRGSTRMERIPTALIEEIHITCPQDYIQLIPTGLPEKFTTRDYSAAAKIHLRYAQTALNVLAAVGAVSKTGKQGRLTEYMVSCNNADTL